MEKYLPFLTGTYSTAPGLKSLSKSKEARDHLIFQIDDTYDHYLANKAMCRQEGIEKYYHQASISPDTIRTVNDFIIEQLTSEYPGHFEKTSDRQFINHKTGQSFKIQNGQIINESQFEDLFDVLCSQVQEDLAVFQLTENSDYLTAVHLCAPNHWSPADKIGKPFDAIHRPVADMEETIKRYPPMLQSIVGFGEPFTRFAWGIGTDQRLNHHPEPPEGVDQRDWEGRAAVSKEGPIYLRVERQNLIGFKEVNAFLFTIRTYHYSVGDLSAFEKQKLWESVQSMSPATLEYKGLNAFLPELERRLIFSF
ncbi:heme-dependent oxidative N-demethylase family protein [Marinoscillum sp.]|uniref:heme-dependent oxidative N-demethylase family protein n=1 Tax=Marinoscillum sp. TaxID=2024838 RepID=UPI003BAA572C